MVCWRAGGEVLLLEVGVATGFLLLGAKLGLALLGDGAFGEVVGGATG